MIAVVQSIFIGLDSNPNLLFMDMMPSVPCLIVFHKLTLTIYFSFKKILTNLYRWKGDLSLRYMKKKLGPILNQVSMKISANQTSVIGLNYQHPLLTKVLQTLVKKKSSMSICK